MTEILDQSRTSGEESALLREVIHLLHSVEYLQQFTLDERYREVDTQELINKILEVAEHETMYGTRGLSEAILHRLQEWLSVLIEHRKQATQDNKNSSWLNEIIGEQKQLVRLVESINKRSPRVLSEAAHKELALLQIDPISAAIDGEVVDDTNYSHLSELGEAGLFAYSFTEKDPARVYIKLATARHTLTAHMRRLAHDQEQDES